MPAKRALIRTRTVALNVTELSTWPTSSKTSLPALAALLLGVLAGHPAGAADIGYPPPPGAYRIETGQPPDLAAPPLDMRPGNAGDSQASNMGSRLLPLPKDAFGHQSDPYGAGNLFGSRIPARPSPPDVRDAPPPSPSDEPLSWRSSPPNRQTGRGREYSDFSMDFDRSGGGREGVRYPAYPPYSAAHPGHPQPAGQIHPGQPTSHAPATATPGHPPEQGFRTGSTSVAQPFPADEVPPTTSTQNTVFRPTK